MQVDWNNSNLGQFYMQVRYRIFLELRKQQRLELPKLFESGKAKSSLLKVFPTFMQLFNGLLENLGRNIPKFWEFLLGFGQVVKLLDFSRKLQLAREDKLFLNGASIYQALTTIAPILYLPQRVVVRASTDFHPLNEYLFLSGVWIDSITMSECQHSIIIKRLLVDVGTLNVKRVGIEPPLIPPLNCRRHDDRKSLGVSFREKTRRELRYRYARYIHLQPYEGVFPAKKIISGYPWVFATFGGFLP
jgi:hypothetical protein